jgi:hypothetical protein
MKPRISIKPDFERFADVLTLRRAVKGPPGFDFIIDAGHLSKVLGSDVNVSGAAKAEAYRLLGYDYVQSSFYCPMVELRAATTTQRSEGSATTHSSSTKVMPSREYYQSRSWSWHPVAAGDLSSCAAQFRLLEEAIASLPAGMKVLPHTADIFTFAWEMIGFENFCLASMEEPEWLDEVMDSIQSAQFNLMREALRIAGDHAGAVIYSDDIAYTEGLMLSPDFFRQALFPRIGKLVEMCGKLPLIYHSDGRLYQVFDDLARLGVRAIQPLEPKSMEPLEIQKRWPGKFCLLGNIDLDLMSRGTPDQVEALVREKIETLGANGGYMPGISNTVPYYVNYNNYIRMIETNHSYR